MKTSAALAFLLVATCFNCIAQKNPFTNLTYDSVVAYNFALNRPKVTILKKDSTLDETTVLPGRKLADKNTNDLLKKLTSKRTYGGAPYACFEPKHAFVFYKGTTIVGLIEICFACNNIRSTPDIPAINYYFNKGGHEIQNYGFSDKGVLWLMKFCRELGLETPPVSRPEKDRTIGG